MNRRYFSIPSKCNVPNKLVCSTNYRTSINSSYLRYEYLYIDGISSRFLSMVRNLKKTTVFILNKSMPGNKPSNIHYS